MANSRGSNDPLLWPYLKFNNYIFNKRSLKINKAPLNTTKIFQKIQEKF